MACGMIGVFFVGDFLMSARLILVGIFALIDRLRQRQIPEVAGGFLPRNALSLFLGKLEILPTALERISGSGPTGVALINGCS